MGGFNVQSPSRYNHTYTLLQSNLCRVYCMGLVERAVRCEGRVGLGGRYARLGES